MRKISLLLFLLFMLSIDLSAFMSQDIKKLRES